MDTKIDKRGADVSVRAGASAPAGKALIACALALAAYFLTAFIGRGVSDLLFGPDCSIYLKSLSGAVPRMILAVCIIVFFMKKKGILTGRGNGFLGGLFTGGYFIFGAVMNVVVKLFVTTGADGVSRFAMPTGLHFGTEQILLILTLLVTAGVCEELIFRGIILNALRDWFGRNSFRGTLAAIILSSILFGSIHFTNLSIGMSFRGVLLQAITAVSIGIYLGAIYCRWGNIKRMIFLHALMDICALLPASLLTNAQLSENIENITANYTQLLTAAIYLAVAIFLMRKSKRKQMFTYSVEE